MRTLVLGLCLVAMLATAASANFLSDGWIRGASSVALNDDATAVLVNPAGLGMYVGESGYYASIVSSGEEESSYTIALKGGPIGFAYDRSYAWELNGSGKLVPGDDAFDTYTLSMALGEPRKFSLGFDYRWFRPQFGDDVRTGTWDIGAVYRPTNWLSLGATAMNLSEPDVFDDGMALPITYTAGLAVRPIGTRLTLMADMSFPEEAEDEDDVIFMAGIETEPLDGLVLRGSFRSAPGGDDRQEEASLGLYFTALHTGVGGAFRSFEDAAEEPFTLWLSSSEQRRRTSIEPSGQVAEIKIAGPLADENSKWSLFGTPRKGTREIIREIERAAESGAIDVVLLRIEPLSSSFLGAPSALVQEMREAVIKAKEEDGVQFVAYMNGTAGTPEYYLATACDRIVMPRIGAIDGLGQFLNVMRYTGSVEKLGIEFDYLTAGDYKSSFHSLGAGPLTDEQRVEIQAIVDENYEETVYSMANGRGLSFSEMESLADGRLYTTPDAIEAGLVDEAGLYADAKRVAIELAGQEAPDDPTDIGLVDVSTWENKQYDWNYGPMIAVIGAYGGIGTGEGGHDPLRGGQSIGSETLVRQLRSARKSDRVEAVVFRINSGGGDAIASDIIWDEAKRLAEVKPLIVSMGNVAASGGYFIACPADYIFADPLTLTGSIGVVFMKPIMSGLYDKIDATYETFKRGEYADAWSDLRHFTEEETAMAERTMDFVYEDFMQKVADGRDLPMADVREIAQGRVFTGTKALEIGLIDELGGLTDAIGHACHEIGTTPDDATLLMYRDKTSFMDVFMSSATSKLGLWRLLDFGPDSAGEMLQMRAMIEPLER